MRRIRSGCCARADSGHAAAPPMSVMKWRRCIVFPDLGSRQIGFRLRPSKQEMTASETVGNGQFALQKT
jgi:hypothetical protein